MTPHRLENYLRSCRKESGLSQREVAFMFGWENSAQVSRYEKRRRLPPLETALAFEAIFGIPVGELFAGVRQEVGRDIEKRRLELKARLQSATPKASDARMIEHKLRWLAEPPRYGAMGRLQTSRPAQRRNGRAGEYGRFKISPELAPYPANRND
jgi:transcriptional regulator with XRE-family HTH domain